MLEGKGWGLEKKLWLKRGEGVRLGREKKRVVGLKRKQRGEKRGNRREGSKGKKE